MHPWPILQALILLALANGAPVIAKKLFAGRFAWPLDGGLCLADGRLLLLLRARRHRQRGEHQHEHRHEPAA